MDKRIKFILASVIFVAFTLFVGVQTLLQYRFVSRYKDDYPITKKARIEFIGRSKGSGTLSFPVYTAYYFDTHNRSYSVKNSTRMNQLYQVGDSLNIRYRPDNPGDSIIDDNSQLQGYLIRGLFTFLLLAAISAYLIHTSVRLNRIKK